MKSLFWLIVVLLAFVSQTSALSTIAQKEAIFGDLVLESENLVYTPPTWFQPHDLATAPDYAEYWIHEVLPYEEDKFEDTYLVIPQLWLVTPVVPIPEWTLDHTEMANWRDIDINKYLVWWVIEYVNSVKPGYWWKRVDFWHSNFFRNWEWRYRTIFANLMRLDPGDQVWYFDRNSSGQYDLHKYNITASYDTDPSNVAPLLRDWSWADALIFGCTSGLEWRWMIEAEYMGEPKWKPVPYVDPYADLDSFLRVRVDNAVRKINRLRPNVKAYTIVQLIKVVEHLRETRSLTPDQTLLIDYIEYALVTIYPE